MTLVAIYVYMAERRFASIKLLALLWHRLERAPGEVKPLC